MKKTIGREFPGFLNENDDLEIPQLSVEELENLEKDMFEIGESLFDCDD